MRLDLLHDLSKTHKDRCKTSQTKYFNIATLFLTRKDFEKIIIFRCFEAESLQRQTMTSRHEAELETRRSWLGVEVNADKAVILRRTNK